MAGTDRIEPPPQRLSVVARGLQYSDALREEGVKALQMSCGIRRLQDRCRREQRASVVGAAGIPGGGCVQIACCLAQ